MGARQHRLVRAMEIDVEAGIEILLSGIVRRLTI
jgi:hypothetical protein